MSSIVYAKDKVVLKSLFSKYDVNNNDSMDSGELGQLLEDLGVSLSSETSLKALKMLIDRDNSGCISFEEFFKWWSRLASTDSFSHFEQKLELIEYAANLFWSCDCSSDNKLGISEFKNIYEKLMQKKDVPASEVEAAVRFLDKDQGGTVEFSELMDWLNWV